MAKAKSVFMCQSCGYESPKWMGKCPGCNQWNTFVEEKIQKKSSRHGIGQEQNQVRRKPTKIKEVTLDKEKRIPTGMEELTRVLGGGIVPGSLVLIGGDPGDRKSVV